MFETECYFDDRDITETDLKNAHIYMKLIPQEFQNVTAYVPPVKHK